MTISRELDACRASVTGCDAVAFGDLQTRLVLSSSHGEGWRREHLDELCDQAAVGFNLADAAEKLGIGAEPASAVAVSAVLLTPDRATLFTRGEEGSTDVLCCVSDPAGDIAELGKTASTTLKRIADQC